MRLRDGSEVDDPRLDRLVHFDERSRAFPLRGTVPNKPRSYTWNFRKYDPALDQMAEGACVGMAWANEAACFPAVVDGVSNELALRIYREAQKIDPWEGESYEGTSVLAGAKVAQSLGFFKEYRWCFGIADVLLALAYSGGCVFGLNWYADMTDTDSKGFISPTGSLLGGHAIFGRGVNLRDGYVLLRNSWGEWGLKGDCKIKLSDLDYLLRQDGEACVPVLRNVPKT